MRPLEASGLLPDHDSKAALSSNLLLLSPPSFAITFRRGERNPTFSSTGQSPRDSAYALRLRPIIAPALLSNPIGAPGIPPALLFQLRFALLGKGSDTISTSSKADNKRTPSLTGDMLSATICSGRERAHATPSRGADMLIFPFPSFFPSFVPSFSFFSSLKSLRLR